MKNLFHRKGRAEPAEDSPACDLRGRSCINTNEMTTAFAAPLDEVVVSRAQAGDIDALESVFRTFETPVYNLARRLCRSPQDAEDVLQETFIEVMRSIHRYRGEGPLAGWIRKVAASKALMRLRQRKHGWRNEDLDETAEEAVAAAPFPRPMEAAHARVDLEPALTRLTETARVVVWLHDVEGYTHEEIAEMMGKTVSFSKSQLARAHARLRGLLEGGIGEEEPCT